MSQTQKLPPPTLPDIAYGPHPRQTYDLWQAGNAVAPIFVFIHGGGWTSGDKQKISPALLTECLAAGLAVASVNYRYSTSAPLPAPVADAARAIQHLRHNAEKFGIDPDRIGTYGGSAGACSSLNLALGPDFAEPASNDPVARQSSRPACAGGANGQTAIDPCLLREWLGDAILEHRMPNLAFGEPTAADMLRNYERHRETFRRFSPYYQVNPQTAVPVFLTYTPRGGKALTLPAANGGVAIHHAMMGIKLKALMDSLNLECHLYISGQNQTSYSGCLEFFKDKLLKGRGDGDGWPAAQ